MAATTETKTAGASCGMIATVLGQVSPDHDNYLKGSNNSISHVGVVSNRLSRKDSSTIEAALDIVSITTALAWATTMLLRTGSRPVLQFLFATISFDCYAVLVLFVLKQKASKAQLGQLFATTLILVAGLLAAPEAHRVLWDYPPFGPLVLIVIDLSVVFLLSMSLLTYVPDSLRKSWRSASKRYDDVSRND